MMFTKYGVALVGLFWGKGFLIIVMRMALFSFFDDSMRTALVETRCRSADFILLTEQAVEDTRETKGI